MNVQENVGGCGGDVISASPAEWAAYAAKLADDLAAAKAEVDLLRETSEQLDKAMIGGSDVEIAKAIAAWRLAIEGESAPEAA